MEEVGWENAVWKEGVETDLARAGGADECEVWFERDRALILGRSSDGAEFSEIYRHKRSAKTR